MKLQLSMFAAYHEHSQGGNMAAQRSGSVRVTTALTDTCWSNYGSSIISAVRCRGCMFLSCPLKLQRGARDGLNIFEKRKISCSCCKSEPT